MRLAPILRNRADAALAIADEMDRNELLVQEKHAMQTLSDERSVALYHWRFENFPLQPIEMSMLTSDYLETTLLFNDRSVDRLADTVSLSLFSEALLS